MFLIGNISGFLVLLAGVFGGVATSLLLKSPAGLFLGAGLTWIVLSLWWKRGGLQTQPAGEGMPAQTVRVPRRSPAIFWIPMHFLAVLPIALGVLMLFVSPKADPREQALKLVEARSSLSSPGGNEALAAKVKQTLATNKYEGKTLSNPRVVVTESDRGQLVYVKVDSAPGLTNSAYDQIYKDIQAAAPEKTPLYVALKAPGAYAFVASPSTMNVNVRSAKLILPFFGDAPPPSSK